MIVFHDSRNRTYRSPAGAQPCGTQVRLYLKTDAEKAQARFWIDGTEILQPMEPAEGGFSCTVILPEKPGVVWYYFRVNDDLGDKGDGSFCPIYLHKVNISVDIYPPCLYTDIR